MSLTRFLPTPSDRMGILWNLLTIEGSVILEYGPAGTTHFSMSLYGELDIDQQNRLFTTHMSEADVVMGDVTRLEKAIVEVDETHHPKVIFVVASSVAAVIGVDLRGVCTYMQDRVAARLIAFEQGGFRGDYSIGMKEVCKMLVREIPLPQEEKTEGTYNIIGASLWSYRVRSDIWEIQSLLREGFGLEMSACLCADTSIEELEQMGSAQLNLVIHGAGEEAARILEKEFQTPYIYALPYGYEQTLQWLYQVGERIQKPLNKSLEQRLKEKSRTAMQYRMYAMMLKEDKLKATLAGEYDTITGIGDFLERIGFFVNHKICMHSLRSINAPREDVIHPDTEKERIEILKSLHRELVLADDTQLGLCSRDNTGLRIASPVIKGMVLARHLPLAGEKGADGILEYVEQYIQPLR